MGERIDDDCYSQRRGHRFREGLCFCIGSRQADGAQCGHGTLRDDLSTLQRAARNAMRVQMHDVLRRQVIA